MTGHRLSQKSHSQDGTKTIGQINRELQEVYDGQPLTVNCAWCPWTFEGVAVEARQAAAFHRSTEHPEKVNGATPHELLDAMDAGEPVGVAPAPIQREETTMEVQCKIDGCENTAPSHGRYAKLCREHRSSSVIVAGPERKARRPRTAPSRQWRVVQASNGTLAAAAQSVDERLADVEAAKTALAEAVEHLRQATEAIAPT